MSGEFYSDLELGNRVEWLTELVAGDESRVTKAVETDKTCLLDRVAKLEERMKQVIEAIEVVSKVNG